MRTIAWDTETMLIRPSRLAPEMVCLSYFERGKEAGLLHHSDPECGNLLRSWLTNKEVRLVGQNVAFDTAVICARYPELIDLVFEAYEEDRITDTKIRQQLLDIAGGVYRGRFGSKGIWIQHNYDLDSLVRRLCGRALQKDGWRRMYGEFIDTPIEGWVEKAKEVKEKAKGWLERSIQADKRLKLDKPSQDTKDMLELTQCLPETVLQYPKDDAISTLEVWEAQEHHAEPFLEDQYRQARFYFAIQLCSAWGLRTDINGVENLRRNTEKIYEELKTELIKEGLVRENEVRNTKVAKARMLEICRRDGIRIRRTAAHKDCPLDEDCDEHVSLDADACKASEDHILEMYAELGVQKAVLAKDVPLLARGTVHPIHAGYGLAETGRTTCSPNVQNLRRAVGIREAFVPREGRTFASADYPQLELYTLAQVCYSKIGYSALGEALNNGLDPHTAIAARVLGISYEEALARKGEHEVDQARQVGKVFNFGKPGGLGDEKLEIYAWKNYGVKLSRETIKEITVEWFQQWPEMKEYFAYVNRLLNNPAKEGTVVSLFTNRYRGGASYCATANSFFQGLGADCAKKAGWEIAKKQYTNPDSSLFGTRTVAFVHDEYIIEVNADERAHDAAYELAQTMVDAANEYLPNVPIQMKKMEPVLMGVWSKKAKQIKDENGKLKIWMPEAA